MSDAEKAPIEAPHKVGTNRRGFLKALGAAGAVAVIGGGSATLAWWQRGEQEARQAKARDAAYKNALEQANDIEVTWKEHPKFTPDEAEVIHYEGKPKGPDNRPDQRWAAVIGVRSGDLKDQLQKGERVGLAYFAPSTADKAKKVGYVCDLNSSENLGRTTYQSKIDLRGNEEQETIRLAAKEFESPQPDVKGPDLELTMVRILQNGDVAPLEGLLGFQEMSLQQLGETHSDIPIV